MHASPLRLKKNQVCVLDGRSSGAPNWEHGPYHRRPPAADRDRPVVHVLRPQGHIFSCAHFLLKGAFDKDSIRFCARAPAQSFVVRFVVPSVSVQAGRDVDRSDILAILLLQRRREQQAP